MIVRLQVLHEHAVACAVLSGTSVCTQSVYTAHVTYDVHCTCMFDVLAHFCTYVNIPYIICSNVPKYTRKGMSEVWLRPVAQYYQR